MVQFKLFGFPIRIHWLFWILCAFLAMGDLQEGGRYGLIMLIIWVGTILSSIMWHELGHAFFRKRYGAPYSEITLWGLGGLCSGPGGFTRHQSMMISFAGPLFNFILGTAIVLLANFFPINSLYFERFVRIAIWVNFGWGILNLLPILPLDGGRIFQAFMANRAPRIVPMVGLVLSILFAAWALLAFERYIFAAFLFGMMAWQNWQMMQGRGEPRF